MKILLRRLLAAAVFFMFVRDGRAVDISTNFVEFPKVEINGKPARLTLVTSLGTSLLLELGAKRLGLKGEMLSDVTQISSAGQSFSAPIPIFSDPILRIPWFTRKLAMLAHPFLYHEFKGLYLKVTEQLEGVVGWPEVRDNILVLLAREQKETVARSKGDKGLGLGGMPLGRGFEEAGA